MAQPLPTLSVDKTSSSAQALGKSCPSAGSLESQGPATSKKWPLLPVREKTANTRHAVTPGGHERRALAVVGFPRASTATRSSGSKDPSRPTSSLTPPPTSYGESADSNFDERPTAHFAAATVGQEAWVSPSSRTVLEDENRRLREELARYQCNAMERHRRPMAAIAGGGFRGASSQQRSSGCNCEALKLKLARCRAELREAQRRVPGAVQSTASPLPPPTPKTPLVGLATPDEMGCIFPPAPMAGAEVLELPETPQSPMRTQSPFNLSGIELVARTPVPTAEACTQTASVQASVEVQTSAAQEMEIQEVPASPTRASSVAVQAGGMSTAADASMQTAEVERVESAAQVAPEACDASQQASPSSEDVGAQTASATVADSCMQAGPGSWQLASADTQTEATQSVDEGVQAEIEVEAQEEPPLAPVATCESAVQTVSAKSKLCTASAQTARQELTSSATQVEKTRVAHQGIQVEDNSARKAKAECEAKVKDLEVRLQDSSSKAIEEFRKCKEESEAWQQMAQSKALGQLNITILCPRAECTVNGTRVEIDSWNPKKLRQEFEDEVLPRFTKLFVEEGASEKSGPHAKPEAVQRTMEEFATVFRERLTAMLSAPNANAAVTAASHRASKAA
eukprot:gb/GFBE01060008.1/.p1 GENE.gb/GFBE01060008.1/~~gb/GFBE01060008.1/.p1  ORF type:complete len:628 (+),score=122.08 gb/GFBE01060008.1/:1-1884(+)